MRLIDADWLKEKIKSEYNFNPRANQKRSEMLIEKNLKIIFHDINEFIDKAPTINAQMEGGTSVGKWIETVVRGTPSIYCSECGSEGFAHCSLNFCPNCGAKMEEE